MMLGLWLPACDSLARRSGFCANSSEGGRPLSFFSLCWAAAATRQSATAAAQMATSTVRAAREAAYISCAVPKFTVFTPDGSSRWLGPATSVFSASCGDRNCILLGKNVFRQEALGGGRTSTQKKKTK